jgi:hypothetical protein
MNTTSSTQPDGAKAPVAEVNPFERRAMDDLRDRLARAEQDIKNGKENFIAFKSDDFGSLKKEVHSMRSELNDKIDVLLEKVSAINLTMAKWMGGGAVIIFIAEFALKKFLA